MEELRAGATESSDDPLDRLAKRLQDSSLDDVDLEEPSAPAIEGSGSPLPPALLRLRDYTVVRFLGRGGMGAVYLAHQRSLPDKQVALKILPGIFATDPVRLARFRNEASTASRLNHPGIVAVLDIGHENDVHYQVQELVEEGRTVEDLIREARNARALPKDWYRTTAELFAKIAEALAAVHAANVLHRDIKPSNILLTPQGEPKVGDFGLAKDLEGVSGMTRGSAPGTLNYKSPEQLDKAFGKVDQRSDVFSLGVTMYEVLTLTRLFPGDEQAEVEPAILKREVEDLRQVRPGVPKDLSTLCRKCLEKQPKQRYQTMAEVAADLRRYLRNEPIRAQEPSRWERAWKWSRRNPGVATGIGVGTVALVVISVVALVAVQLADENALLATKEASAKQTVQLKADQLAAKVRDFNQLAGVERLNAVLAKQEQLWPAWPDKVEELERWLREECGKLLEMEPEIRRTVDDLRSRAMPRTPAQIEADRRSHPRFAEFELLTKQVASLRYAQAIRSGQQALVVPDLTTTKLTLIAKAQNARAWARVAPSPRERVVWGEEAQGLTAARAAVAKAGNKDACVYLDTLAWALLANGQDAEAKAKSGEALACSPDKEHEAYAAYQQDLTAAIDEAAAILAKLETALADVARQIDVRRTWLFAATADGEAARFLHETLTGLLVKLSSLSGQEKLDVEQRLRWAKDVLAVTKAHPRARVTWQDARAAIAKADGIVASTRYAGVSIPLPDDTVIGLVPIGMNPLTKLWEFYDLRSAWDGERRLDDIPIPAHKSDGSVDVTGETGIVLVLLPGGEVTLGSQSEDKAAPYYDHHCEPNETLYEVALSPFFLARHEMTQGQWARLWTWDTELRHPSRHKAGTVSFTRMTLANPVEQVDWLMCHQLLTRHGMALPSEAQWEYGCRGATTTPWIVDIADLRKVANVADADGKRGAPNWACEEWADGHAVHASVGSFGANQFGLYDMHGNVWEWCRDHYYDYGSEREGDGTRPDSPNRTGHRCCRGGGFSHLAAFARSANRFGNAPSIRDSVQGLRPARLIKQ